MQSILIIEIDYITAIIIYNLLIIYLIINVLIFIALIICLKSILKFTLICIWNSFYKNLKFINIAIIIEKYLQII
jgi:uncharacterized protein HemY